MHDKIIVSEDLERGNFVQSYTFSYSWEILCWSKLEQTPTWKQDCTFGLDGANNRHITAQ